MRQLKRTYTNLQSRCGLSRKFSSASLKAQSEKLLHMRSYAFDVAFDDRHRSSRLSAHQRLNPVVFRQSRTCEIELLGIWRMARASSRLLAQSSFPSIASDQHSMHSSENCYWTLVQKPDDDLYVRFIAHAQIEEATKKKSLNFYRDLQRQL